MFQEVQIFLGGWHVKLSKCRHMFLWDGKVDGTPEQRSG